MAKKSARKPNSRHLNDEGEPQTAFLRPGEGGSYLRNKDGSLTRTEHPTGQLLSKPKSPAATARRPKPTKAAAPAKARKARPKKGAAKAVAAEPTKSEPPKASEE